MSDDEKPPEKPTQKLPADEISTGLVNKLVGMVTDIKEGVHSLRADVGLIANDVSLVKERISLVESRTSALEEAKRVNSERARGQSQADLDQSAALAAEKVAREALASEVAQLRQESSENLALTKSVVNDIGKALKNPLVGKIVIGVLSLIAGWLASKGVHF